VKSFDHSCNTSPTQQHNNTTTQQHNNTTTQQHNNNTSSARDFTASTLYAAAGARPDHGWGAG
jgi:hypothetical protein